MSDMLLHNGWELVVGLEVHVELATKTKLFSGSPNRFGDEPNTNIDPVTLGLPGALPVLNQHAVELAMRIGIALNCTVQPSTFHRKNYFYPDMPNAYQISQYACSCLCLLRDALVLLQYEHRLARSKNHRR